MGTAKFDWSVWDLRSDGLIEQDGELFNITVVNVEEGDETVKMIKRAADTPHFLTLWKECHACDSGPGDDTMVITTSKHYIAPCYDCEIWCVWDREVSKGGWQVDDRVGMTLAQAHELHMRRHI